MEGGQLFIHPGGPGGVTKTLPIYGPNRNHKYFLHLKT